MVHQRPLCKFFSIFILITLWVSFSCASENLAHKKKPKADPLLFKMGNVTGWTQIKFKPESFFLGYSNLLNTNNRCDNIYLSRSTIDYNIKLDFGSEWFGHKGAEFFMSFRNKATWGNPNSIAQTTETNLKLLEVVFGDHNHFITRHVTWIRELWFNFCINDSFNLGFKNQHYFTMGAFPFELGRGISLGSAFAVGPRILGFFSDNAIDQYAFGFKLYGDVIAHRLSYDIYAAILENKADSISNTAAKVRGQEFGRKFMQERGPGKVNFIIANRWRWRPISSGQQSMFFEPYVMYNYSPEQKVEFIADANSRLGTFGLAGEFKAGALEWGFDTAVNVGRQQVPGWDRNVIEFENREGIVTVVNSRVRVDSSDGPKAIYVPGSQTQRVINTSAQSASQNGQLIGTVNGTQLFNDNNRFRSPSTNSYKGWMFIADAIYSLNKAKTLKIAVMAGAASGDRNPNQDLERPNESNVDGDFKGFIGLQEIYSGSRVQSVFLLGGTGKAPRPLFIPSTDDVVDRLPSIVSGFTNLVLVGSSIHWYPERGSKKFGVRPNIIAYWQQVATNAFDRGTNMASTHLARNYLGLEINAFTDCELFDNCKLYAIGSTFIPGSHYKDIKGTPLTRDQLKFLDNQDKTGVIADVNPLLGDNIAYTINVGIECRF